MLGVIKPKLWIVTTPNRDYNELFPEWPGPEARRHWDHKFEWSREEFKLWIEEVVKKYPEYANVKIDGVGFHQKQEFHESHGPASQIVIFRSSVERSLNFLTKLLYNSHLFLFFRLTFASPRIKTRIPGCLLLISVRR